jgi:hypothetical protein
MMVYEKQPNYVFTRRLAAQRLMGCKWLTPEIIQASGCLYYTLDFNEIQ